MGLLKAKRTVFPSASRHTTSLTSAAFTSMRSFFSHPEGFFARPSNCLFTRYTVLPSPSSTYWPSGKTPPCPPFMGRPMSIRTRVLPFASEKIMAVPFSFSGTFLSVGSLRWRRAKAPLVASNDRPIFASRNLRTKSEIFWKSAGYPNLFLTTHRASRRASSTPSSPASRIATDAMSLAGKFLRRRVPRSLFPSRGDRCIKTTNTSPVRTASTIRSIASVLPFISSLSSSVL